MLYLLTAVGLSPGGSMNKLEQNNVKCPIGSRGATSKQRQKPGYYLNGMP